MPYTPQYVLRLISRGENEETEFKWVMPSPSRLARTLCAFANAKGGTILIGVREPDSITGTDPSRLAYVVEQASSYLDPKPKIQYEVVTVNSLPIAVITVQRSRVLVTSRDGVLVRRGSSDVTMPAGMIVASISTQAATLPSELTRLAGVIEQQTNEINFQSSLIERQSEQIGEQSVQIRRQANELGKLRQQTDDAGHWQNKLKDWVLSGIVGTAIGIIIGLLIPNPEPPSSNLAVLIPTPSLESTTPYPTYTSQPTYTPFPTFTPYPTDTPIPPIASPTALPAIREEVTSTTPPTIGVPPMSGAGRIIGARPPSCGETLLGTLFGLTL